MCNLLFSWAKAEIFAEEHHLNMHTFGWGAFHIGPWIRGERVKRYYKSYFKSTFSLNVFLRYRITLIASPNKIMLNPQREDSITAQTQFIAFSSIPLYKEGRYFVDIQMHRNLIKKRLFDLVKPHHIATLQELQSPQICVHIRRGDFKKHPLFLDNDYFVDCIQKIRKIKGQHYHVTIFSDGYPDELTSILALDNINMAKENIDIIDLLLMSKSKVIVTSLGSTFSYWAGFLSDADIILHPKHAGGPIRASNYQGFEGTINNYMKLHSNRQ